MLKSGPSSILFLCFFLTTVQYAVFFYFLSLNRTWYELPFFNFWWFGKSVVADYPVNSTMICTSSSYRTNVVITSKMVLKSIEITPPQKKSNLGKPKHENAIPPNGHECSQHIFRFQMLPYDGLFFRPMSTANTGTIKFRLSPTFYSEGSEDFQI